jgi:cyd operon protein YbgT
MATTPTKQLALLEKEITMWYFAWILGLLLAAGFAVLNAMWYELMDDEALKSQGMDKTPLSEGVSHGAS